MPVTKAPIQGLACFALLAACHIPSWAADASAGAKIAANGGSQGAAACVSCHGSNGEGGPGFPPLAGQSAGYLERQLLSFAAGKRKAPTMEPNARALTDAEKADVAAYYASLKLPIKSQVGPLPTAKDSNGAWLVERGRWGDGIPACAKCHGPGGTGVGLDFPAIGHLSAAYMQSQVDAWQKKTRDNGPLGLMGSIAQKLTPKDIQDVAAYYQQQHGSQAASN
ncbi:cytochrome c [Comamonas sp. GB3 AK4-5]|uniref:c-type cytochrome n=1 Tax=Comamonas sp. GB3 AK4-5 TaxID=3231487 RepID=UPI00351E60E9